MEFLWPRFSHRPASSIDGVFLVDSLAFSRGEYGRRNYMQDVLQYILWSTGLCCMAIVVPGAWYQTFSQMASSIPDEYGSSFFVVVLACGNDVYSIARKRARRGVEYIQEIIEQDAVRIADGVGAFLQDLRRRTTGGILLVFGGGSDIWKYHGDFALVYNVYVKLVLDLLRQRTIHEVSVIRGEALRGIETTDRIGHISDVSLRRVAGVYALFARQAYTCVADAEDAAYDVQSISKL